MAIQSDETLVTKGDLKELYQDKILPYLGGNVMMTTNVSDYYREDEKVVGIWTNGKPLYQKTFVSTFPTLTTTGEVKKDITIGASVDNIVNIYGCFNYYNTNNIIMIPYNSDIGSVYLFGRPDNTSTTTSKNTISIAVNPKTVDAASKLSENSIVFTILYTKTTDTTSTALATPGCYDLNRPDLWPSGKEIFFGNGLYGKRFIGTFTSPTSFNTNLAQLDTIDRGTTFKFINRGGNIFRRNDTAMPLGVQDTLQYDIWYANSSSSQDVGLRLRGKDNGAYSCSYDIWVTYIK